MRPQKLACFGIENSFDHPFRLAQSNRLAIADEREAPNAHLMACLLGLCFGISDAGHLRRAIGATGNAFGLDRMRRAACDHFSHHDALMTGLMRKPGCSSHIANGIDTGHRSAAISIGFNMGPIHVNAKRLKPEILNIAHDPDSRDHRVKHLGCDFTVLLNMRSDRALTAIKLFHHGFCANFHSLLFKSLLREGGNFRIFHRHHPIHHLHHRGINAERVIKIGKFDTNCPGANHQELFRHARRGQSGFIGPNQIPIPLKTGQFARPRPGGNDDMLGR